MTSLLRNHTFVRSAGELSMYLKSDIDLSIAFLVAGTSTNLIPFFSEKIYNREEKTKSRHRLI